MQVVILIPICLLLIGYGQCGVCNYEIQGIDGFIGEVLVEGRQFIAMTVFRIMFMLNGVPVSRQAILENEPYYFTISITANDIMATRSVPVGISEQLVLFVEGEPQCLFYLTVKVVDIPVLTTIKSGEPEYDSMGPSTGYILESSTLTSVRSVASMTSPSTPIFTLKSVISGDETSSCSPPGDGYSNAHFTSVSDTAYDSSNFKSPPLSTISSTIDMTSNEISTPLSVSSKENSTNVSIDATVRSSPMVTETELSGAVSLITSTQFSIEEAHFSIAISLMLSVGVPQQVLRTLLMLLFVYIISL